MKRYLAAGVGLASLLIVIVAAWLFSGVYDIAADQPHWTLTSKFIDTLRDRSIDARAKTVAIPSNLGDARVVKSGAGQFAAMCSSCHTAPGEQASDLNQGLYPRPTDFTKVQAEPARSFWVIKHGIKMSGMPAWGGSHDDEMVWALVGFLQKMPSISAEQYQSLIKDAPDRHMESMDHASPSAKDAGHMAPMK